jgi:hypothetical protein
MDRTARKTFVTPCYSYGAVEFALAWVFGADDAVRHGALRGRLKHLGRLGWPGIGRGKGQRVLYSHEQAVQLLIALMLEELGIDPSVIVGLLKQYWEHALVPWVLRATDVEALDGNPVFLALHPRLLSGEWSEKYVFEAEPLIRGFHRFEYHHKNDGRIRGESVSIILDRCTEDGLWLCCHNLTDRLSKFQDQLVRYGEIL